MNIPLVMTAAPLNENNNSIKNNNFLNKQSNTNNNNNNINNINKKNTNILSLKKAIQDIHNNSIEEDNDLYNSLSTYEPPNQKSKKINYEPPTDLQRISNTNKAYDDSMVSNNLRIDNKDELLNKINYIIYTLDKQKDIKGEQKIEEILLYSFIGIFIIYVLDSFTKIGKYKR